MRFLVTSSSRALFEASIFTRSCEYFTSWSETIVFSLKSLLCALRYASLSSLLSMADLGASKVR